MDTKSKNRKKTKVVTAEVANSIPHLLRAPRTTSTPINERRMIPTQLEAAMRKLSANLVENVRYAMETQGHSWSSLSHAAGLSTSTIYPIKNGRTNVGTATACQLGVALGLGIEEAPKLFLPHSEFLAFYSPRADSNTKAFIGNINKAMDFHGMEWKDVAEQWGFDTNLWKSIASAKKPLDNETAGKIARSLFVETHELENMFKPSCEFDEWYAGKMKPLSENLLVNVNHMLEKLNMTINALLRKCGTFKSELLGVMKGEAAGLELATVLAEAFGISEIGPSVLFFENSRFVRAIATRTED